MKTARQVEVLAGVVVLAVGCTNVNAVEVEKLSVEIMSRMDADKNGCVSKQEYFDFGTAYLENKGRKANPLKMEHKFNQFDRNGDGYITESDPTSKTPKEVLCEKIQGTWISRGDNATKFIFLDDGQADIIQKGVSFRDKACGKMSYCFIRPKSKPTSLDVVVKRGSASDFYYKCIIEFCSDTKIKMRLVTGGLHASRPQSFDGARDVIILDKQQQQIADTEEPRVTLFGRTCPSR